MAIQALKRWLKGGAPSTSNYKIQYRAENNKKNLLDYINIEYYKK